MTRPKIIAEVGNNHLGSVELAVEHVRQAAKAGADIVKFQLIIPKNVISYSEPLYPHVENLLNENQRERWERVCLSIKEMEIVKNYCKTQHIEFLCTPFCFESLEWVADNCERIKIASSDALWGKYLDACVKTGREVLISTGICSQAQIADIAVRLPPGSTIMHCVSSYPTPLAETCLGDLLELKKYENLKVGLSDHTVGVELPIAACLLGLSFIEKHFILDRSIPGGDRELSINPAELATICRAAALGDCMDLRSTKVRSPLARRFDRGLYASKFLTKGVIIQEGDLREMRPLVDGGFHANDLEFLIGRTLIKEKESGAPITKMDIGVE